VKCVLPIEPMRAAIKFFGRRKSDAIPTASCCSVETSRPVRARKVTPGRHARPT
jgi:hypothetical protein